MNVFVPSAGHKEVNEAQEGEEGPLEVARRLFYRLSRSYQSEQGGCHIRLLRQAYTTKMEATQVPGRSYLWQK